ncbi:MAG: lactate racemase domain-containing protein [Isosphaeraceae bacterium]
MLYIAKGAPLLDLSEEETQGLLDQLIEGLEAERPLRRVLLIPPDFTRAHSGAGPITCHLYQRLKDRAEVVILPALGTHFPLDAVEREAMFPGIPEDRFRPHDWRHGVTTLGEVPASVLEQLSEGKLAVPARVQVDDLLVKEKWDAILSIGQLVPHEVIGIANHVKNILVGVGGPDLIHKSHWLGAVYGMERIMGRPFTPVRALLNWAAEHYLADLPIVYVLTVRARNFEGQLVTRGLYADDGLVGYSMGQMLCRQVNLDQLNRAPKKVVVWLDPQEFKSTWLGNKAIYRTRMAIDDGGELVILAPGVRQFGEDPAIDGLIRKYGYRGTPATIAAVAENADLAENLSAAAHLIHGSSEGRFHITYCPGSLSRDAIEGVGYGYADLETMRQRYAPDALQDGWNVVNGEEIFYVSNPALGLWGTRERFGMSQDDPPATNAD